jgi:hypothetical protein
MFKVLFIGDVIGKPGRRLVRELLPGLVDRNGIDLVVANGENSAGGLGLTEKAGEELFDSGVDLLTGGNHTFQYKGIEDYLDRRERVLRPANYPGPCPGKGSALVESAGGVKVGVLNIIGRTFMTPLDCPFRKADAEIARLKEKGAELVLVDFHGEATSEKKAMGLYLDGRVGAVVGTHTHVQTADEEVLPGGAAYITDLGMTGPHRSVIGMKEAAVLERFLTGRPSRFEVAKRGLRLEGAIIFLEPGLGRAVKIERLQVVMEK